jgi:hypothetical protein
VAVTYTPEGIIEFLAGVPLVYAYVMGRQLPYIFDSRALRYMLNSWLMLGAYFMVTGISLLLQSPTLFLARHVFLALCIVTLEYSVNHLIYDRLRSIRYGISVMLATAMLVTIFLPDAIGTVTILNRFPSYEPMFPLSIIFYLNVGWLGGSYLQFTYLLHKHAPAGYSHLTRLNARVVGIGALIILIGITTRLDQVLISIDAIAASVLFAISIGILRRYPKLFFLVPNQPLKLIIFEMESGNNVYSYDWDDEELVIPVPLFATALESIHLFINEALNKGKLKEILLEKADIIIHNRPENQLTYVLLAEKSSYVLKRNFEVFIDIFETQHQQNYKFGNVVMVDNIEELNLLVQAVF